MGIIRRAWVGVAVGLVLVLASGCSLRQMVISRLDWLLMREMNDYFDLTEDQYAHFRAKGRQHLNWFRESQIPTLIADIEGIRQTSGPLAPEKMFILLDDKARALWLRIADRLAADAALLFEQLSPEQYAHFQKRLAEDSEELIEIMDAPPDAFAKKFRALQEDLMDSMETWVGPLTDFQKQRILEITAMRQEDYRREVSILLEIKSEFLRQVQVKVKEGGVEDFLKAWARQPNIDGARYEMYQQWQVNRQLKLWIDMETMVTPTQKAYRDKQLARLIEDLKILQATSF